MATAVAPRVFKNFINGEWVESRSGKAYENRNPANTDELIGMFVSSNEEDVDRAEREGVHTWEKGSGWHDLPRRVTFQRLPRLIKVFVSANKSWVKFRSLW